MRKHGWTFAINTSGTKQTLLDRQIKSIQTLNLPAYEILIIGGPSKLGLNVRHIEFDENQKMGWITRKKNLLALEAEFDQIVFLHDYISIQSDWAAGFELFGSDWNVAMNRVEDVLGRRFYDWIAWDSDEFQRYAPIPYSRKDHTSYQFIPGAYWVAKTEFMLANPLDESLSWGESEDVEWSLRVRDKGFVFNPYSSVRHLKRHRGFKLFRSIYKDGFQLNPRPDYLNWDQI